MQCIITEKQSKENLKLSHGVPSQREVQGFPGPRRTIKEVTIAINRDWVHNQTCRLSHDIYDKVATEGDIHMSYAFFLWDTGKQCRQRFPLFSYRMFFKIIWINVSFRNRENLKHKKTADSVLLSLFVTT